MSAYHHKDLKRQLLIQAAQLAATEGPESITLRELARRTNVSHSAPVHHFGTRKGLLTCLAVEGFESLNEALSPFVDDIYAMGVSYVLWALGHPGHYAIMWQPRHLSDNQEEFQQARKRVWSLLATAVATNDYRGTQDTEVNAHAAFALVHGLAEIWISEALPEPENPKALAEKITRTLRFSR